MNEQTETKMSIIGSNETTIQFSLHLVTGLFLKILKYNFFFKWVKSKIQQLKLHPHQTQILRKYDNEQVHVFLCSKQEQNCHKLVSR